VINLRLAKVVFNISVSIILILLSLQIISTKTYMMIHDGLHDSHERITWDYEYAVSQTMRYLNGFEDDLEFPSFEGGSDILMTERGLLHMEDVKALYTNGKIIIATAIVLASVAGIYLWDKKQILKTLRWVWVFPTVSVGLITLSMLINFSWTFRQFHLLLFTNDLWMLSPLDPLIIMLPYQFFFSTAITVVVLTVLFHALTVFISYKKTPRN